MSINANSNRRTQIRAVIQVATYRPFLTAAIVFGGAGAALMEGIGLSFILPIVEIIQSPGEPTQEAEGVMLVFISIYRYLGVPLTLGSAIIGVSAVLGVRWSLTFLVRWLREALVIDYTREIQKRSFENALEARIEYFDREGSDDILNAIVTQAEYAGGVIKRITTFLEQFFLAMMYLTVAIVLAPYLTFIAVIFLAGFTLLFRNVIEPGYDVGDKVADANKRIQQAAQAGTQGIRDTKLFGLKQELFNDFKKAVDAFARSSIKLRRNEQAITSFYNYLTALSVFVLIYLAITFADLSLGALGIFLFAMFRLGPKASSLNSGFYRIENTLPHLVRTLEFIDELEENDESVGEMDPVPSNIDSIEFVDVRFSYDGQAEKALKGISFEFEKGEFIGFVGQSGAGKSTIVSLLTRMYEPNQGEILADGRPIHQMNIDEWRTRIAVVRQDPYIFNDTLRYNLTVGNRDASLSDLRQVCRVARVDEFYETLPNGFETQLGDDGVRLSGGQRQRVALARALLTDAELLILDEATSDLDSNLEKQVQNSIESMDREYAMIGIAHRLSTVKNADRIYTIDSGKIVESGTHEELLRNDGKYAQLYAIQSESG